MTRIASRDKSRKRAQADMIRKLLLDTGKLTERQTDMVVAAAMSMPDETIGLIIEQAKEDPENILKDVVLSGGEESRDDESEDE